jgi:hypothetical protein
VLKAFSNNNPVIFVCFLFLSLVVMPTTTAAAVTTAECPNNVNEKSVCKKQWRKKIGERFVCNKFVGIEIGKQMEMGKKAGENKNVA